MSWRKRLRRLGRNPVHVIAERLRRLRREFENAPHENRLGIRTARFTSRYADFDLQTNASDPVPYRALEGVARHMAAQGIAPRRFADLGCGLGRPLYYFAARFDELIGYEIAAPIAATAQAELARVRGANPDFAKIRIEQADAAECVPLDQPLVLFLYNPFGPKPMTRLCARLRAAKTEVHLYYVNPVEIKAITASLGPPTEVFRSDFGIAYFRLPAG
jgi:SAM-dependent methyltransferase